jgi:hypothetical protein
MAFPSKRLQLLLKEWPLCKACLEGGTWPAKTLPIVMLLACWVAVVGGYHSAHDHLFVWMAFCMPVFWFGMLGLFEHRGSIICIMERG